MVVGQQAVPPTNEQVILELRAEEVPEGFLPGGQVCLG